MHPSNISYTQQTNMVTQVPDPHHDLEMRSYSLAKADREINLTHHCSQFSMIFCTKCATIQVWFLKTWLLHWSQMHLATGTTSESKALRLPLATCFQTWIHHSAKLASWGGVRCCQFQRRMDLNQTSLLKAQPSKRWSIVSVPWEHRGSWLLNQCLCIH
jgi:hypothetical protein